MFSGHTCHNHKWRPIPCWLTTHPPKNKRHLLRPDSPDVRTSRLPPNIMHDCIVTSTVLLDSKLCLVFTQSVSLVFSSVLVIYCKRLNRCMTVMTTQVGDRWFGGHWTLHIFSWFPPCPTPTSYCLLLLNLISLIWELWIYLITYRSKKKNRNF